MRDDEGCAAGAQRPEAVLDHRLTLAVEARGSLVENQDAGIGENGASDGHPLALTAGEAHAALADDRVVLLFERLDEFVAVRDAADSLDLFSICVRLGERDVLRNRPVEEEIV